MASMVTVGVACCLCVGIQELQTRVVKLEHEAQMLNGHANHQQKIKGYMAMKVRADAGVPWCNSRTSLWILSLRCCGGVVVVVGLQRDYNTVKAKLDRLVEENTQLRVKVARFTTDGDDAAVAAPSRRMTRAMRRLESSAANENNPPAAAGTKKSGRHGGSGAGASGAGRSASDRAATSVLEPVATS